MNYRMEIMQRICCDVRQTFSHFSAKFSLHEKIYINVIMTFDDYWLYTCIYIVTEVRKTNQGKDQIRRKRFSDWIDFVVVARANAAVVADETAAHQQRGLPSPMAPPRPRSARATCCQAQVWKMLGWRATRHSRSWNSRISICSDFRTQYF